MTAKGLEQEMQIYFTQLSIAEKKSVIQMIKTFLQRDNATQRISIEQYNKEIEATLAEVAAGNAYTHDEVVKLSKSW